MILIKSLEVDIGEVSGQRTSQWNGGWTKIWKINGKKRINGMMQLSEEWDDSEGH